MKATQKDVIAALGLESTKYRNEIASRWAGILSFVYQIVKLPYTYDFNQDDYTITISYLNEQGCEGVVKFPIPEHYKTRCYESEYYHAVLTTLHANQTCKAA